MSRFALPSNKPNHAIAMGLVEPFGWFFQLFAPTAEQDEYGTPLVDEDSISRNRLLELIDEHADKTSVLTQYVQMQVALDLEPDLEVYRQLRFKK